jgi:hypothetical protein
MFTPSPVSVSLAGLVLVAAPFLHAAPDPAAAVWARFQQRAALATHELAALPVAAPVASADVTVLPLSYPAMFEPAGERGLEYTAGLRELEGRRVQVTGFMVREERRAPGLFLLTPRPVRIEGTEGIADLPPTTVHVVLEESRAGAPVGYRPGQITVTGTLELGVQPLRDGRNSIVRVRLEDSMALASVELPLP